MVAGMRIALGVQPFGQQDRANSLPSHGCDPKPLVTGNWPHLIEVGTTLHLVWQEPIGPAANERGQVA